MKALIIIPAFNEEDSLPNLLKKLKALSPIYDTVIINDNSNDGTGKCARDYGFTTIDLPANLGIGGAVQTGLKYALYGRYDAAVQVDADGQHDPRDIELLLSKIKEGWDLSIGSRFIDNKGYRPTASRRAGIRYFSMLIRLFTGQLVTDPTSGFRAFGRKAIGLFANDYPNDYPEPESIVNAKKNGLSVCEVPVAMNKREEGKSSITALKAVYYMIKVSLAVIISSFRRKSNPEVD